MQIACRSRGAQSRSRATQVNAICYRCGTNRAVSIHCRWLGARVCGMHRAPFGVDRRRAIAETHQQRMSDLIHKCGKTADVQLELPHDARLAIAACLWSGWPLVLFARSGVAAGLRPEFVPSPHLATWWAERQGHYSLRPQSRVRSSDAASRGQVVRSRGRTLSGQPMHDAAALLNRAGTSVPSAQVSKLLLQMTEDGWSVTDDGGWVVTDDGGWVVAQPVTSVVRSRGAELIRS